jgi:hypothetical protein
MVDREWRTDVNVCVAGVDEFDVQHYGKQPDGYSRDNGDGERAYEPDGVLLAGERDGSWRNERVGGGEQLYHYNSGARRAGIGKSVEWSHEPGDDADAELGDVDGSVDL